MPDAISLEIFRHLFASVAEEMGLTLGRTGYSPNIKERLDFSCAIFTGTGDLLAQAEHMPVHLGAMPASVRAAIQAGTPFAPGDVVILNDPYLGGTHLPDITLVSPVFVSTGPAPDFFVASRAHHADIGGMTPGSMPLSTELYQEGLIIPPIKLFTAGARNTAVWDLILRNSRTPHERRGDLAAQLAAHAIGERRLHDLTARYGPAEIDAHVHALLNYAERLTRTLLTDLPDGVYTFRDHLCLPNGDPAPIHTALTINDATLHADFTGTAPAVSSNLNAVPAIVESALVYVIRVLAGDRLPMNAGVFRPLTLTLPPGSLLNAQPPHAVAAGNVETSQRIVDVLFGALAQAAPHLTPAASQGTMNNLTFGGRDPRTGQPFAYYETIGGGAGGGPHGPGASGTHVHMSNTRNTPIEALEYAFPLRITHYGLRPGSGGHGQHPGGQGIRRTIQFLVPVQVTVLSERRDVGPWGLAGGLPGEPGRNTLLSASGAVETLPAKFTRHLYPNDTLQIDTPGGGGWGTPT